MPRRLIEKNVGDRVIFHVQNVIDGSEVTHAPVGVLRTFTFDYTVPDFRPF